MDIIWSCAVDPFGHPNFPTKEYERIRDHLRLPNARFKIYNLPWTVIV